VKRPLVIFGSAEMASLARFYFEHDSDWDVVAFTVDDAYASGDRFEGLPLVPWSEAQARYPAASNAMHVALSYRKLNALRQQKFEQAKAAGYTLASYVCSKSVSWPGLTFGENCFILENQTLQPQVTLGDDVMLWSGNHIGHGTSIADHAYIASHVVISGHCTIGKRCFIGVNATVRDFCRIGDDCFVGMGACVTRDLDDGAVAVGTSAQVFEADDRRARALKKKYFGI
jgi:sugar O-acyltransferase (sialic acid O-acetyltransferase NeuD family)